MLRKYLKNAARYKKEFIVAHLSIFFCTIKWFEDHMDKDDAQEFQDDTLFEMRLPCRSTLIKVNLNGIKSTKSSSAFLEGLVLMWHLNGENRAYNGE